MVKNLCLPCYSIGTCVISTPPLWLAMVNMTTCLKVYRVTGWSNWFPLINDGISVAVKVYIQYFNEMP